MANNAAGYLIARVKESICINCGLCLKVCPGKGLPKALLRYQDMFRGDNITAYIGHANDEVLWKNGQSGGVVSALLLFLLDSDLIDGAVINRFDNLRKRPSVSIARSRKEIIDAQGSIYSQSAVNEVALNTNERVAAVLLGCQSEGLMLSRSNCPEKPSPAFTIGLICAGNYSGKMIDELIRRSRLDEERIISFKFREKNGVGWPGDLSIETSTEVYQILRNIPGAERREGDMEFTRIRSYYWNYRCLFCFDQMNIFSDIVVGDPWGIDCINKERGESVFIARTRKGEKLIEEANQRGVISIKPVDVETIYKGQTVDSRLKKQYFEFLKTARDIGLPFPKHDLLEDNKESIISKKAKKKLINKLKFLYSLQKQTTEFGVHVKIQKEKTLIAFRKRLAGIYRKILGII
jgi:coenzyme F420 hydrogenase subunit beta